MTQQIIDRIDMIRNEVSLNDDERLAVSTLTYNLAHIHFFPDLSIQYVPDGALIEVTEGNKSPQKMKFGKFVQRYWELCVYMIEAWDNALLGSYGAMVNSAKNSLATKETVVSRMSKVCERWGQIRDDLYTHEIVEGDRLVEVYEHIGSCMSGSPALALYQDNPDKVKLLRIMKDGETAARALIWTADDGTRILDRIYPNSGPHISYAQKVAREEGWLYRSSQSAGDYPFINPDGTERTEPIVITLQNNYHFPYLDSFCWGFLRGGANGDDLLVLSNVRNRSWGGGRVAQLYSTCNDNPFNDKRYSRRHGRAFCEDEVVFVNGDWLLLNEDVVYCNRGSMCGSYIAKEEAVEFNGYTYHQSDMCKVTAGSYAGEMIPRSLTVRTDGGDTIHQNDMTTVTVLLADYDAVERLLNKIRERREAAQGDGASVNVDELVEMVLV